MLCCRWPALISGFPILRSTRRHGASFTSEGSLSIKATPWRLDAQPAHSSASVKHRFNPLASHATFQSDDPVLSDEDGRVCGHFALVDRAGVTKEPRASGMTAQSKVFKHKKARLSGRALLPVITYMRKYNRMDR